MLICMFHTLRTFRREITCETLGITSDQRILALDILQKICYAKSEEEFQSLCNQLERDGPVQVTTYFKANWLPIRKEWVLCLKAQSGSFLNTTNNRLESINGKLKQVISKRSTLEEFVDKFL